MIRCHRFYQTLLVPDVYAHRVNPMVSVVASSAKTAL